MSIAWQRPDNKRSDKACATKQTGRSTNQVSVAQFIVMVKLHMDSSCVWSIKRRGTKARQTFMAAIDNNNNNSTPEIYPDGVRRSAEYYLASVFFRQATVAPVEEEEEMLGAATDQMPPAPAVPQTRGSGSMRGRTAYMYHSE